MAKILSLVAQPVFCIKGIEIPFALVPVPKAKRGTSMTRPPTVTDAHLRSIGHAAKAFSDALEKHAKLIATHFGGQWSRSASYGVDISVFVRKSADGDVNTLATTIIEAGRGILWTHENQIAKMCVHKMIIKGGKPHAVIGLCVYDGTGLERRAK